MVFQNIVLNLLNSVLGDFVENINATQFNVALWQGCVVLNNLRLKTNALDDLDLGISVKLKFGVISQLMVKIPWSSLYSAPVEAQVDGLYAVLVPHADIEYDEERERKREQTVKMNELAKVEAALKHSIKKNAGEEAPQGDTFGEKIVTLIVKNLQVSIKNIHVRYEDEYTNHDRPFAVGITLNSLYFQTTNEKWRPTFVSENTKFVFKLIDLDSFSFYWNSNAELIGNEISTEKIVDALKNVMPKKGDSNEMTYVLAPLSVSVTVKLNTKPEEDAFSLPKIFLSMQLSEFVINVGKYQFDDMRSFIEAQNRLKLKAKYRKFRPHVKEYTQNAKIWWRFAYQCTLDNVQQRLSHWSWPHIKEHICLRKMYKSAWVEKLINNNPSKSCLQTIDTVEKKLNVFNLHNVRELAELEVDRRHLNRAETDKGWINWAFGWLSDTGAERKDPKNVISISSQIENALTKKERKKLYKAMNYVENQDVLEYPEKYISTKVNFLLKNLSVVAYDDLVSGKRLQFIVFKMNVVSATVIQQPATRGVQLSVKLPSLVIKGKSDNARYAPNIEAHNTKVDIMLNLTNVIGTTVDFTFTEIDMMLLMTFDQCLTGFGMKTASVSLESKKAIKAKRIVQRNLWEVKNVKDCKFWFLKGTQSAHTQSIFDEPVLPEPHPAYTVEEELYIAISAVNLSIDSTSNRSDGSGTALFNIAFGLSGVVQNWSSELEVEGGMSMEVAYFNQKLQVWEPVLEPIEKGDKYKPWEISLNIKSQKLAAVLSDELVPPPQQAIAIVSTDILQLTITKLCLDMFCEFCKDLYAKPYSILPRLVPIKKIAGSYPVVFHNVLPLTVTVTSPSGIRTNVKSGDWIPLDSCNVEKSTITVQILTEDKWTCSIKIEKASEELKAHTFTCQRKDGSKGEMDLGVRTTITNKTLDTTLYCPFWMLNKTGLDIMYKSETSKSSWCSSVTRREKSIIVDTAIHSTDNKDPLMFTFNGKNFFKKKKACLKVDDSEWSESFPVDAVGSAGRIVCKCRDEKIYDVTFSSHCFSSESSSYSLTIFHLFQVIPFWPKQSNAFRTLSVRFSGTNQESLPFSFHESFEAFVPIKNEYIGVYVSCHVSENSVVIDIEDYQEGMAPALLVNATKSFTLNYTQDVVNVWNSLLPGTCVLFNWDSLIVSRILVWSCGSMKHIKDDLFKDSTGEYTTATESERKGYWTSFLDGRQRIIMFTEDPSVAFAVSRTYEIERIDQQITFSFDGVGISLIDDVAGTEIAYISITSSGLVWECKKKHYKVMTEKESREMENAFVLYMNEKLSGKKVKSKRTIGNLEVDFERMHQYKPIERDVRRTFQAGFWFQYKISAHQQHFHLKINHLQVDNQLQNGIFPVTFAPLLPPQSVMGDRTPKPFAEVSFVARKEVHSPVLQVKYFKILVQEVALRVDHFFMNAIFAFYYGNELEASIYTVHFSYSQGAWSPETSAKQTQLRGEFLNLFMKSFGVTLTEAQDVVFKLAYFEKRATFLNRAQILTDVMDHYTKQGIKQAYVLVFGLDIIGNPFGLVRDLSTGIETFFYEPFHGAIQGPEEFAEGLALGVKSLFGSTVGGAVGAVSRITGTVGKGLAALTLDTEYQKKRQQILAIRPAHVHESFFEGGKGVFMGFYEGVTGVVTQPYKGARRQGISGFFKGVGKGLIGLVVRPVSGVVDFTSASFETVKRLLGLASELKRIRSPRFIRPDKIVRIFSSMEADGNQMLQVLEEGKYSETDSFIIYADVTGIKAFHLIVTNKRVIMTEKNEVFGTLEEDWSFTWRQLAEPPSLTRSGVLLKVKKPSKNIFGKASAGKLVHVPNDQLGQWIVDNCCETFQSAPK